MRTAGAAGRYRTSSQFLTKKGVERLMTRRMCNCGRWHWSWRDSVSKGRQKEVSKLCPECFERKYGKKRPLQYRYLTDVELKALQNEQDAAGVRSYRVDPSTSDLLKAHEVIRALYKKNTPETVAILKRLESELDERGYAKFGTRFYKKADLQKLNPLSA